MSCKMDWNYVPFNTFSSDSHSKGIIQICLILDALNNGGGPKHVRSNDWFP